VAASRRPVARAGSAACAGRARHIGRVGPAGRPGRSSRACREALGPRCGVPRASGSGWPSARRSAPLGPLARRVGHSGRSAAFGIAGQGRAGWNGAGRGVVNPVDAGVAEVPETVANELDKGNMFGHSGRWPGRRPCATDYRYVRAVPTLVT
jgi:hypothetical protein